MTMTNPTDTGFAPWSLMTPDPGVSKRAETPTIQQARLHHRDGETHNAKADDGYMFGEEGFTFGDFLDVVNPLHHLPVVGAIYRSLTGDQIDPGAKLAGGTLYGGPVGLASGVVNAMIEEHSGDDIGGHAMAFLFGDDDGTETLAAETAPIDVAALPPIDGTDAYAGAAGLLPANANGGAINAPTTTASLYNSSATGDIAGVDMASALFAANGNSAAAANVAAFNQGAFRRSDLTQATASANQQQSAQQTAANTAGPARISQRLADHLAKLAGQTPDPAMPLTTPAPVVQQQPAPRAITGPLPEAFSANAPEGNPFATAAVDPMPIQTADLSAPAFNEPVQANQVQAAISQTGNAAVGYDNPNDIARAMMNAIERYEQQRAKL